MSFDSMCTTAGTLQKPVNPIGKDTSGGSVRAPWSNVAGAVNVPCDIQPASGDIRRRYEQIGLYVSHTLFVARDVAARAKHRFVVGSRTFLVHGYEDATAGRGEGWLIHAEEQLT
jgi:hypothetical protein